MVYSQNEPMRGLRPCIVAQLAPGWRWDAAGRCFVRNGESLRVESLPRDTRIEPRFPDLAARDPAGLSADEAEMARYIQFVLPPRARAERHLERIKAWPSIDDAHIAPAPSLPEPGSVTDKP